MTLTGRAALALSAAALALCGTAAATQDMPAPFDAPGEVEIALVR